MFEPYKDMKPNTPFNLALIVLIALFSVGCETLKNLKEEHPAVYEAGKGFFKVALNSAKESFLAKNPEYRDWLPSVIDGIPADAAPAQAAATIRTALPTDAAREQFSEMLIEQVPPLGDAPAYSPEHIRVMQTALQL